ncbi:MAG: transglutaminase family protein [Bacteroidota bacterium]|nr:transglutaminase family protein [Bacteroidota bacterium]
MDNDKRKIQNLLNLLGDPDELIWHPIRDTIIQMGKTALPVLQEHWQSSDTPSLASRIQELIDEIQFNGLRTDWIQWWNSESGTLKEGVVLFSQIIDPDYNYSKLDRLIKPVANEIWIELSDKLTALEKTRIVNYILLEKLGLIPINNLDSKSKHLFIPSLLSTYSGHSLAISLLYCLLCRELSIPVYKAGNGEDSALAYIDTLNVDLTQVQILGDYPVFFYILPDHIGEIIGMKYYTEYLSKQFPTQRTDYKTISDKQFIRVMLQKLYNFYKEENKQEHLFKIKQLLSVSLNH